MFACTSASFSTNQLFGRKSDKAAVYGILASFIHANCAILNVHNALITNKRLISRHGRRF
jgi:hypothetical protein